MRHRRPRKPSEPPPEGMEYYYGVASENEKRKFFGWMLRPKGEVVGPEGPPNFPETEPRDLQLTMPQVLREETKNNKGIECKG